MMLNANALVVALDMTLKAAAVCPSRRTRIPPGVVVPVMMSLPASIFALVTTISAAEACATAKRNVSKAEANSPIRRLPDDRQDMRAPPNSPAMSNAITSPVEIKKKISGGLELL
jgi:hypothetical protein